MKLTDYYLDLPYYDYSVYFRTVLFGPDQPGEHIRYPDWHGEKLAIWLKSELRSSGFFLSEPVRHLFSWQMTVDLKPGVCEVNCENIKNGCTTQWKITFASTSSDGKRITGIVPKSCDEFVESCKTLLCQSTEIESIEWNVAYLNSELS